MLGYVAALVYESMRQEEAVIQQAHADLERARREDLRQRAEFNRMSGGDVLGACPRCGVYCIQCDCATLALN